MMRGVYAAHLCLLPQLPRQTHGPYLPPSGVALVVVGPVARLLDLYLVSIPHIRFTRGWLTFQICICIVVYFIHHRGNLVTRSLWQSIFGKIVMGHGFQSPPIVLNVSRSSFENAVIYGSKNWITCSVHQARNSSIDGSTSEGGTVEEETEVSEDPAHITGAWRIHPGMVCKMGLKQT